uniref:Uncharacterized protein n=1 Tax=Pipistrellus kuhlii TaxID=59472 RepID=A0A7J7WDJ8_PIPKU|nr:hypothetical protein mPipKuh1_008097 [Pipistrellus kuhlii]
MTPTASCKAELRSPALNRVPHRQGGRGASRPFPASGLGPRVATQAAQRTKGRTSRLVRAAARTDWGCNGLSSQVRRRLPGLRPLPVRERASGSPGTSRPPGSRQSPLPLAGQGASWGETSHTHMHTHTRSHTCTCVKTPRGFIGSSQGGDLEPSPTPASAQAEASVWPLGCSAAGSQPTLRERPPLPRQPWSVAPMLPPAPSTGPRAQGVLRR